MIRDSPPQSTVSPTVVRAATSTREDHHGAATTPSASDATATRRGLPIHHPHPHPTVACTQESAEWRRARAQARLLNVGGSTLDDDPEHVPGHVIVRAKEAFGQRAEGQVAALVFDSLIEKGAPGEDHLLRFEHPLVQVELRVSARAGGSTLLGRFDRPVALKVQVQFTPCGLSLFADVVENRFSFEEVSHGIVRMNLFGETEAIVRTDWFRI